MNGPLKRIARSEIFGFLVAGGVAAAANFLSRFFFDVWLAYEVSILAAFMVGLTVGFVLMREKVFKKKDGKLLPQIVKYLLVNALAVLQTLLVSVVLRSALSLWMKDDYVVKAVAHFAGVVFPVFVSYYLHRNLTFR